MKKDKTDTCSLTIHDSEVLPLKGELSEEEENKLYARVLDEIGKEREKKMHNKKINIWKLATAACLCIILIPTGTLAAKKLISMYQTRMDKQGLKSTISVKENTSGKEKKTELHYSNTFTNHKDRLQNYMDSGAIRHYVKLVYDTGDLAPDYTLRTDWQDQEDPYSYAKKWFIYKQDKNSKYEKDFTIELNYIADDVSIEDYNVADADTITIDHHTAYYTEEKNLSSSFEKYSSAFPKSLRVFYPEYGYYLRYNAMMHLSKTRLFQIADKITLKEVDASQTDEFEVVDKKYLDLFKEDEEEERKPEEDVIYYGTLHEAGETVKLNGIEYRIQNAEVRNTVQGLKDKYILMSKTGFHYNDFVKAGVWTKNGRLKPVKRETYVKGNGSNRPLETVTSSKKIQPKLVYITLHIKNTTDNPQKIAGSFGNLSQIKEISKGKFKPVGRNHNYDGIIDFSYHFEPFYVKGISRDEELCWETIKAKEEKDIHLGYLVDETYVHCSCLNITEAYESDEDNQERIGDLLKILPN